MPHSATELAAAIPPQVPPAPDRDAALLAQCIGMVSHDLAAAETRLHALLESNITVIPEIGGHLAFAGGKRLRPLLALLCAQAAGCRDDARITVAAAGELLHTATLLHDDVIDEGEFRRGRPSPRVVHGNGMAVLTGDYCLARSVQAIAQTGHVVAMQSLADTVTLMAEGEVAQLDAAGAAMLSRARYELIIERKTATLISWCTEVAGLVEPAYRQPLRRYGLALGYAFQIADDVLDYRVHSNDGPGTTGKDAGQDLREGKWTLPLLLACEADPALREDVHAALRAGPPMPSETVADIVARVVASDAVQQAKDIARGHAADAVAAVESLPDNAARRALQEIATYVVRRSH